tara:strand:+ start:1278 stop:1523 length:246 start_codon:yes stop_codon:yes gene_type:complete
MIEPFSGPVETDIGTVNPQLDAVCDAMVLAQKAERSQVSQVQSGDPAIAVPLSELVSLDGIVQEIGEVHQEVEIVAYAIDI